MPTVALHYDVEGWAYHRRCLALQKYAPADFTVTLGNGRQHDRRETCDLVLQLCYNHIRELRRSYKQRGLAPVMVAGVNVGYTERNARWIASAVQDADYVVLNNRDCFERAGSPAKTTWISNGVDRDLFRIRVPIEDRKPRVLWTGSLFHRPLKGYDEFLIPISRRLWKDGIKCDFRLVDSHGGPSRRTPEEMADWYNTGTVYLCSSSSEGTPNPALEAAASGCTIVSTPVGNMPELIQPGVNGYLADRSVDALYSAVKQAVDNYREQSAAMQSRIVEWGWDRRAAAYFELFRKLLTSSPKKVRRRI